MTCPCDVRVFPLLPLAIPAGLDALPRQIGAFPEFRAAMLTRIAAHGPLIPWRARASDDLGVMLIELWAYVCDAIAFYDQVLADEAYVRTAKLRPSVRRLTGLLGYVPRPAIASSVRLGMLVEGRQPLLLPAGTAVRSAAFGGEPPQIFETDAAAPLHPDANHWTVVPPRATLLSGTLSTLLLRPSAKVKAGKALLLEFGDTAADRFARVATSVTSTVGDDGARYVKLELDAPVTLTGARSLPAIRVLVPTQAASLWSQPHRSGDEPAVDDGETPITLPCAKSGSVASGRAALVLDGLYRSIRPGDLVLVARQGEYRWFAVSDRSEPMLTVTPADTVQVGSTSVEVPAVKIPATQLELDATLNAAGRKAPGGTTWSAGDSSQLIVHYGLVDGGQVAAAAATLLQPTDPLALAGVRQSPSGSPAPTSFFLSSADERGVEIGGGVNFASKTLTPNAGTTFTPPLELPVSIYGNLVPTTRGERVPSEILGSGDASLARQSLTLTKKPLTYVPSVSTASEWGAVSTLTVWVDGVRWTEVASFYGAAPDAQIYLVRQTDDGASVITFGDGVRGARLPTGIDNVVASYRFGAGAASPPADSVKQIARPVKGLKSVVNPVAAAGGADAETADELRVQAPRSALLLGRAVSIRDLEAAAASVAGVRAASAEWRWQAERQRPVAQVWYIGGAGLEPLVSQRLRGLSDPSTPIHVEQATGLSSRLSVSLATDPRRVAADVVAAVKNALTAAGTGMLVPERLGIGRPLFRSELFRTVLSVEGVGGVQSLDLNEQPFSTYGKSPGAGQYFDFEGGAVGISGSPSNG